MTAQITQEIAENGVLTRVKLPAAGKKGPRERVSVFPGLLEAAGWVEEVLAEETAGMPTESAESGEFNQSGG